MVKVRVNSDKVKYTPEHIEARYDYETTQVEADPDGGYVATPQTTCFTFQTKRQVCWIFDVADFAGWLFILSYHDASCYILLSLEIVSFWWHLERGAKSQHGI